MNKIEVFNDIIRRNNQFAEPTELYVSVAEAWDITDLEAKVVDNEYCNVISFYALCFASGILTDSLTDFILKGKKNDLIRKDGFMKNKSKILRLYDYEFTPVYMENFKYIQNDEIIPDGFYQMKISSPHFMGCYCYEGILYLSDTNDRGIGVIAKEKIKAKQFEWIMPIEGF